MHHQQSPQSPQSPQGEHGPRNQRDSSNESATPQEELAERDRAILDFERRWWRYAGAKEQAIRELFDLSATRYYQLLNALIDRSEALEYDPVLVKRLRRMRASRERARSDRQFGTRTEDPSAFRRHRRED